MAASEISNSKKDDFEVRILTSSDDESKVSIDKNPFSDTEVAEYYRALYNESNYESRQAFDPEFYWTDKEEKRLVRKLNYRVALTAAFLFVALQLDRGNLVQAVADNMLEDLKINTNDYNVGNQIFYASFLLAEIPSQLISKRLGPDIFVPAQMCAWSIVAMSQVAMHNKAGFYICRALIGMLEGGFIADLVLWLSYFFTSDELTIRLSWFWTSLSLVQILSALLAYGVLRMRGIGGLTGWQWLFLLEGIVTLLIGLSGFYLMVPGVLQTRNWMHPKGWFNEREEKIAVNRVLRDDPSKGDMNNRQALSCNLIWDALTDYYQWPIYFIGLIAYLPYNTLGSYLTLSLKSVGFGTLTVQLLSIPNQVLHILMLLGVTLIAAKTHQRAYCGLVASLWNILFMGIIRFWGGSMIEPWPTFVITSLLLASPYVHAICVGWVSRNSNSIKTRAISSAVYNIFVQLGSIISSQIYRNDDKPLYHRGNLVLFVLSILGIPAFLGTKYLFRRLNRQRTVIWNGMTKEERLNYLVTTKDKGNKRLDFRFGE